VANVKKIGNDFEKRFAKMARASGFFVLYITPNARGAQPFDFLLMRNGFVYPIDCKTCVANSFSLERVEDNQRLAFDHWLECGGLHPFFAVEHDDKVYMIPWHYVRDLESVRVTDYDTFEEIKF
jgi:Holliday junction resolvase